MLSLFTALIHKHKFKGNEFLSQLKFLIFATRWRRNLILQTMNSVSSKCLSLKYQGFTPSGCKDIGIRRLQVVSNTQFVYLFYFSGEKYRLIIIAMLFTIVLLFSLCRFTINPSIIPKFLQNFLKFEFLA